jgi:hypothetical protein
MTEAVRGRFAQEIAYDKKKGSPPWKPDPWCLKNSVRKIRNGKGIGKHTMQQERNEPLDLTCYYSTGFPDRVLSFREIVDTRSFQDTPHD